jgi:hypothetical protein
MVAAGEWLIIGVILVGVVISIFVVFWEALRRIAGAAPAAKSGEPLPNADYTKYIWNAEDIGRSPVRKSAVLTYDGPQRVAMSFFVDLTKNKNAYLDPVKPIRINGDIVPIKDLPADPSQLKAVKKESVDVTKFVRTGPQGLPNDFEVNYISRGRFKSLRGSGGKMTLMLAVTMPKAGSGIIGPTKFCMNCQFSMPMSGKFCPNCGVPVEAFSGTDTKNCVNCTETIGANALYCSNCGAVQPNPPPTPPAATQATAAGTG